MPRERGGTRSALLDAALDAFAAKGFAGASVREITRAVGIRESAFYAHFVSKRAAYDELFAEAGPPVAARALDAFLPELPPQQFLPEFAATIIEAWSASRARKFAAIMMRDAFDGEAQGWRTMKTSIFGVIELLLARFRAWQAAGLVRADLAADTLVFEFMATITMARFLYFNVASSKAETSRGREVVKEHAATFASLIATHGAEVRSE
jgi:AcrR family transcriptional regulator